ncbi:MAG: 4'-phosphopantetheinyl transferase superfamily protein [Bdellovibrionota bacterium]
MIFSKTAHDNLINFLGNDFIIRFSADYGSHSSDHRHLIRQTIATEFGDNWSALERQNFLDLQQIPKMPKLFVSISHTHDHGVWIVGPRPVGIDLEQTSRISEKIIARVCSAQEISNTTKFFGSSRALWTAKESAFKALSGTSQIRVLSEIEILWDKKGEVSQGERFYLSESETNKKNSCNGFAILSDSYGFSVAILNS